MKYLLVFLVFVTFFMLWRVDNSLASPREALQAMSKSDWATAREILTNERNATLNKLYEYMLYTDNSDYTGLPFENIVEFLRANQHWPDQESIRKTAERNITRKTPVDSIINYFLNYPPLTGEGLNAYAYALNDGKKIQSMLIQNWSKADMNSAMQSELLRAYGASLPMSTHQRRLDHLLFNNQDRMARDYASALGAGYVALIEARLRLEKDSADAEQYISRIPQALQNDTGLLFERLRWRRKNDMDSGAIQILDRQPEASQVYNMNDWWKERQIIARRMIKNRDYKTAYRLAADHGSLEGQEYAEAEWLAGWLALRFLNDPARGLVHFQNMQPRMKTAISKARASYWTARSLEAGKRNEEAMTWYQYAMQFPKVYYGQLAAGRLRQNVTDPVGVIASAQDRARVQHSDLGQAIRMTNDANLRGLRNKLIKAYADHIKTGGEFKALAEMLTAMNLPQEALKVAKKAAGENFFLKREAYPLLMSYFDDVRIDKALAHGLIRQESQFDVDVKSPAGALGLMQLMPATAREVAAKNSVDHRTEWLTSNPKHNILLGSAFLNDLIHRYDGAYPMAMAAYNAGPGRVREWIRDYGDPRTGAIDWIDWIELIPIYETRNYVQRVSESYIVYRDQIGVK